MRGPQVCAVRRAKGWRIHEDRPEKILFWKGPRGPVSEVPSGRDGYGCPSAFAGRHEVR